MAVAFKLSLHLLILYIAVIGQGAVIIVQQIQLNSLKAINIPATIRVREDAYTHPNGPLSEDRTSFSGSRSGNSPPVSP